jgi:hypothetical protein
LSQTVLDQMDEEAIGHLLGDTPTEHRSSALNHKLAQRLEQHREAPVGACNKDTGPRAQPPYNLARQFPGLPDSALEALLATSAPPNRNA